MKTIKAVFIDYTGTTVQENGKELQEVVERVCKNSDLHEPKSVIAMWWKLVKQYEDTCYKENFLTEDEIVDRILKDLTQSIHLKDSLEELHQLLREFWIHSPLFPDVEDFFIKCNVPIYIISNNGEFFIKKGMEEKGLKPAGIVSADSVLAFKPHREIFEKALEISGCAPEEVIHIGDSYESDAKGALEAGIKPVLIQRKDTKAYEDIMIINELSEILSILE